VFILSDDLLVAMSTICSCATNIYDGPLQLWNCGFKSRTEHRCMSVFRYTVQAETLRWAC